MKTLFILVSLFVGSAVMADEIVCYNIGARKICTAMRSDIYGSTSSHTGQVVDLSRGRVCVWHVINLRSTLPIVSKCYNINTIE
jgi:hypothetical protein